MVGDSAYRSGLQVNYKVTYVGPPLQNVQEDGRETRSYARSSEPLPSRILAVSEQEGTMWRSQWSNSTSTSGRYIPKSCQTGNNESVC